jgi:hypothetical protein
MEGQEKNSENNNFPDISNRAYRNITIVGNEVYEEYQNDNDWYQKV